MESPPEMVGLAERLVLEDLGEAFPIESGMSRKGHLHSGLNQSRRGWATQWHGSCDRCGRSVNPIGTY
jgi:hypothetical protein